MPVLVSDVILCMSQVLSMAIFGGRDGGDKCPFRPASLGYIVFFCEAVKGADGN
jgi:hypothetical protein